jgi:hypothetical protein
MCGGVTGSHITRSDVTGMTGSGTDRKSHVRKRPWPEVIACACATVSPRFFSYCSSSTSTMAWVCACATGSCAIFALVGPFDRKWRYETSPIVTEGHPKGVEGVCACTTASSAISGLVGCSLGHRCLSFSSPGYHPLSRHFIFI